MANEYPPTPPGFNLWGMLGQLGLPNPDAVLAEIQRLNDNLEHLAPSMGLLAQLPELIANLTAAVARVNLDPQQVKELTAALTQASAMGEKFAGRLWPDN
ncbi:hypothetical protein LCGC14_2475220 [marine sediment metagenome]|uniref:Uncharacterized protein n=1 Tax=marine sediment metagenome TaxID=412755 RepID=A0A0F9BX32_9ZZZZ